VKTLRNENEKITVTQGLKWLIALLKAVVLNQGSGGPTRILIKKLKTF